MGIQQIIQNHQARLARCWLGMLENPQEANQDMFNRYYQKWLEHPLFGVDETRTVQEIIDAGDFDLIETWLSRLENPNGIDQIRRK